MIFLLVTYDVETMTPEGRRRLRHVAKTCMQYGKRVQNSVFECLIDYADYPKLKHSLIQIIDENKDSLRFYNLGAKYNLKTDHYGKKPNLHITDEILMI